jgi:CHRD domain
VQRGIFIWISFFLLILAGCGKTYTNSGSGNSSANEVKYGGSFMVSDSTYSSSAYGSVTATFNTVSHALDYTISWHSLSTLPVGMHFHDAGPIIIKINNFPVALDGTVSGSAVLTSNQADDLGAGSIYAMIHSQKYPNGEIMAYLFKQ